VILLDTSGLLAALDASQQSHVQAAACLADARPPLLLSPFVLAELDYLLGTRVGSGAQSALLAEIERGAYALAPIDSSDVGKARQVMARHADLRIGLADASIAVLAERHSTNEVLTLDQRHFRVLTANGKPFRILPADAS
jgi:predicted nucleic acid-binding protein